MVVKAKLKVREHIALKSQSLRSGLCQRGEAWIDGRVEGVRIHLALCLTGVEYENPLSLYEHVKDFS